MTNIALSQHQEADELLSRSPLALTIGLVLDQQISLEKAFLAPWLLEERLGHSLDAGKIASMDTDVLVEKFSIKPALHRFPASMAKRVQDVCGVIATDYGNDASQIWREAGDSEDLLKRIRALPGFGEMKAKIFVALLGKQVGLKLPGWEQVSAPFGDEGTFMSVADIVDRESLSKVREFKAAMKVRAKMGQ